MSVAISPASVALTSNSTQQFAVLVRNADQRVEWSVDEPHGGSITDAGLYTAPDAGLATQVHVRATSQAVPTKSGEAVITVTPPLIGVTITPNSVTLDGGVSQTFSATVAGAPQDLEVLWQVDEAGGGSITDAGVYTAPAPADGGLYHVRATAHADVTKHAEAAVTVLAPPSTAVGVTITPPSPVSLASQGTQQFSAAVANSSNQGVTWSVLGSGCGSITAAGLYSAPAVTGAKTCVVKAVSQADGTKSAQVSVNITPGPPVITSFTANPTTIIAGGPVTLSWNATAGATYTIDNGVGDVTGKTSKVVTPADDTTYTLTVSNAGGLVTKTVSVAVTPNIQSFTAAVGANGYVVAGSSVTLSWTVIPAGCTFSLDGNPVTGTSATLAAVSSSATHRLTATNAHGSDISGVTFTVAPASPAPYIENFSSDASSGNTTLRWSVANSASVTLDGSAVAASGSQPAGPGTHNLVAGSASASVTIAAQAANTAPADPGGSPNVVFTLDSSQNVHPISPLIYGFNFSFPAGIGVTLQRSGGNRLTAYNWETNASNAGSDFNYQNDNFMSSSSTPAAAIFPSVDSAVPSIVTLPMEGWVSADEAGACSRTAPQQLRFLQTLPRKGSSLSTSPDKSDRFVYQDEFVNALVAHNAGWPILLSLDNEPDLWFSTHNEVQRSAITYAQLLKLSVDMTSSIKDMWPQATMFGPVSYGYAGYLNLQSAPDAGQHGGWFLDYFLQGTRAASDAEGRRLLDVLDLHYYSEATGNGVRVNDSTPPATTRNSAPVQAARVQAPRSLWDPTFKETSWITQSVATSPPYIDLIPIVQGKIASGNPGTRLSFTEYDFGGSDDISGAVAEADALGVYGVQQVYAATYWPELSDTSYVAAAFRSFRNFDGAGGAFRNTSFSAVSSDNDKAAVYASVDSGDPTKVVVVAINRTTGNLLVNLRLAHSVAFTHVNGWQVVSGAPTPAALASNPAAVTGNAFQVTLPGYSVTTFQFVP